jgi:uncharacterized protein
MYDILAKIVTECWLVLGEMAPYLLLGFLMAGVLSVCISPAWIERHLGGSGYGPVLKAALFGVPLPLCSCGVIPVGASIRRHGASRAATASFLLSTAQTGVDSIAVTYALLGGVFAIFRPIAALLTGLIGGALVQLFGQPDAAHAGAEPTAAKCTKSCCTERHTQNVVLRALRYGLVTLPRDIGLALLVGIAIAGVISAVMPQGQLKPYVGGGIGSMFLMMAVGVPVYVCATASVPIAAAMIHMGASPGAALAFLIAGPATNPATITTVWKLLGRRTAMLYMLTIILSAVFCGLSLDWLFSAIQVPVSHISSHIHTEGVSWFTHVSAVALLAVMAYSYASGKIQAKRAPMPKSPNGGEAAKAQDHLELAITGMTCSHCAVGVGRALSTCRGVDSAEVDLNSGRAIVCGRMLDQSQLLAAVVGLGYDASVCQPPTTSRNR